jgi:carboxypeptidase T
MARWRSVAMLVTAAAFVMADAAMAHDLRVQDARRDGHKLIRLSVQSNEDLAWLQSIGAEPWRCIPGIGLQEFSLSPQALTALEARGRRYRIISDNIQPGIDAELTRMRRPRDVENDGGIAGPGGAEGPGGFGWFSDYKTWPEVNQYMDDLVALRPDLITKLTVGTTIQNRTIHGMRITSPVGLNKPAVLFSGCQHAREWIAVMVPMYIADALVRRYDTDAQIHALMDQIEFFIVPIVNPDGYEHTYLPGGDRLWRKNRRNNGDGTFGVDLNRNWGVDWGGPSSTTTQTNGSTYIGTAPFSEPETAALRDFIMARPQLRAHIDFHSYSQVLLQNWAHTTALPPDADVIDALGTVMNQRIFAVNGMSYSNGWGQPLLYLASGIMPDWCYGDRGIISYTIELRDRGETNFQLPPEQIVPTAAENLPAALAMAEWVTRGVEFLYPRGRPVVSDPAAPAAVQVDVRSTTAGPLVNGSVTLHARSGAAGPFVPVAMANISGDSYQATLPSAPCGQVIQWYIEVQAPGGGGGPLYRSPPDAPASVHESRSAETIIQYDFETTPGWTTSNAGSLGGQWHQALPTIDTWVYSPPHDADGSGECYVTGGFPPSSDVSGGTVTLMSPVLNLSSFAGGPTSSGAGAVMSYAYFLHVTTTGPNDVLVTEVSANDAAGPWIEMARDTVSGGPHWRRRAITQAELQSAGVSMTSTMRLRFRATDGNPVAIDSVVEAGIDAVRISDACDGAPAICLADVFGGNDVVNIDDLLFVINSWGQSGAPGTVPADVTGNGVVDVDDLLAVVNAWGPCP